MLRRLYDWTMSLAGRPRALWALAGISFAESSFFPIPPDALLLPMVLAAPKKAWQIAMVCTTASALGGVLGYLIGAFLFESVGREVLAFYGYEDAFAAFQQRYQDWGVWIVAAGALTPLPYKAITILSGAVGLNLPLFIVCSVLARGFRFFLEAGLLKYFGPSIREFVEDRLALVTTLSLILLMVGFALLKLI